MTFITYIGGERVYSSTLKEAFYSIINSTSKANNYIWIPRKSVCEEAETAFVAYEVNNGKCYDVSETHERSKENEVVIYLG